MPKKPLDQTTALAVITMLADTLCIAASMAGAYYIRIESAWLPYKSPVTFHAYSRAFWILLPLWVAIFAGVRLYSRETVGAGTDEYSSVFKACSFGVAALIFVGYWERTALISRGVVLLCWAFTVLSTLSVRVLRRAVVGALRRRGHLIRRTLIIGASEHGRSLAQHFRDASEQGVGPVGFLDDYAPRGTPVVNGLKVLGLPADLLRVTGETGADTVIVIPEAMSWQSCDEVLRKVNSLLDHVQVLFSPGLYEISTLGVRLSRRAGVPLLSFNGMRISRLDGALKTLVDLAVLCLLAIPAALAMAIIAASLRIFESGPVLERYRVFGARGRQFVTYKFRTESRDCTRRTCANRFANLVNWPETSRLREFLYQTGLDKLPQLLNILSGQMSVIGPRTVPATSQNERTYAAWLPSLLTVKPGMTGPWVFGPNEELEEEINKALLYIRNWSMSYDLQLLMQTAAIMLTGRRTNGSLSHSPSTAAPGVSDAAAPEPFGERLRTWRTNPGNEIAWPGGGSRRAELRNNASLR